MSTEDSKDTATRVTIIIPYLWTQIDKEINNSSSLEIKHTEYGSTSERALKTGCKQITSW